MFEIPYQYCISTLQYLCTFITIYTSFLESIHIFFTAPSTANFGQKDHEEILQVRLHIQLQNHLIRGHVLQPLGRAPDGAPGNGASTKGRAICQLKGLDVLDGGSGLSKSESRQLQLGNKSWFDRNQAFINVLLHNILDTIGCKHPPSIQNEI